MLDGSAGEKQLLKGFISGTHRLVPPEETVRRIRPLMSAASITRLADMTGLDRLGLPVYCAIRPLGETLQSAWGKGLTPAAAQASALMEAFEHMHADSVGVSALRTSAAALESRNRRVVAPKDLPDYCDNIYYSRDFVLDWLPAKELFSGSDVWLPAGAVGLSSPALFESYRFNGLASGNHLLEATLHALYETVERDIVSRAFVDNMLKLTPDNSSVVDIETVDDPGLVTLIELLKQAQIKLVLISLHGSKPIHTFWAVLLDQAPESTVSTANTGYGSHLNPAVAAVRAVTEAAQSRLTFIHGAREDTARKITDAPVRAIDQVYSFFSSLPARARWQGLVPQDSNDFAEDYQRVLNTMRGLGVPSVYRVDLTRPPFDIPVVKVLATGLTMRETLF